MPGKNTLKVYVLDYFYHIYNRGWNRTEIFLDELDYLYFERLLAQRLSPSPVKDAKGREYMWLRGKIDLVSYCLMPNHFHLLVYQRDIKGVSKLLQSVCTAYTIYFNKKYKRRGPLLENRFKAVLIQFDAQLQHITRYIHLNHKDFRTWPHASYKDYLSPKATREWVQPQPILDLFDNIEQYKIFVDDYEALQRENDKLKKELADAI